MVANIVNSDDTRDAHNVHTASRILDGANAEIRPSLQLGIVFEKIYM